MSQDIFVVPQWTRNTIVESGSRLEFHIIYRCVDQCIFCSEETSMKRLKGMIVPREDVLSMLEKKRKEGFEHVTLTGGEPTFYPKFWEIAAFAKNLGYRVFVISNGWGLSQPEFAEKLLPYIDELCLSIHGPNKEIHDKLTRTEGSFEKLMGAFKNVEAHPARHWVQVNHVVTRHNVSYLPKTLELFSRNKKLCQFLVSNVTPHGGARHNYKELAVQHKEITSQIPTLVKIAHIRRVSLRFYGIPVCLLGPYWRYSNDLFFSPRTTIAKTTQDNGSVDWLFERAPYSYREKFFPKVCDSCVLKGRCGGIYFPYTQIFGDENLKPFTPKSLRELSVPPIN
jgi:MoaA/NifB/PqqE/SkfB family radical SAM enzyme